MWWALSLGILGCAPGAGTDRPKDTSTPATAPDCLEGELWDGAACVPEACGLGPWSVSDADIYVLPGASGAGSADDPVGTLADALDRAPTGRVALGAGTWNEPLTLDEANDGLALLGRCPALTVLDGAGGDGPVVGVDAGQRSAIALTDLTVTGGEAYGISLESGRLTLTRVWANANTSGGIRAEGTASTLNLVEVEARDNHAPGTDRTGSGLEVHDGANLDALGLRLVANESSGLLVEGTATGGTVTELHVEGTLPGPGGLGLGLDLQAGGTLTVVDGWIGGCTGVGVSQKGARLVAERLRIEATAPLGEEGGGDYGYAVFLTEGSTHTCTDCAAVDSSDAGVYADDSTLSWSGRVEGVRAGPSLGGIGILIDDSEATLEATELTGWHRMGVYVSGASATLTGNDLVAVDSTAEAKEPGSGLGVDHGAYAEVSGLDGGGGAAYAAWVEGADARLVLDAPVARAADLGPDLLGFALLATSGGTLEVTGGEVDATAGVALAAVEAGSRLWATDTRVTGGGADGAVAAACALGAELSWTGGGAEDLRELGVWAADPGTLLALTELDLVGVVATLDHPTAAGLLASDGGGVELADVWITEVSGIGAVTGDAGTTLRWTGGGIDGVTRVPTMATATGLSAEEGSTVELADWEARGVEGPGLLSSSGSELRLADGVLTGNAGAQAIVRDGSLTLERSTLGPAGPDTSWDGRFGVFATDRLGPYALELVDVTVEAQALAAVWVQGEGELVVSGGRYAGGPGGELKGWPVHGNALYAREGATVRVSGATLHDARVAVLLDGVDAEIEADWVDNDLDLRVEGCVDGEAAVTANTEDAEWCPPYDTLVLPLEFQLSLPEWLPGS